jgi:phosphatidylglycerophosphate synthase
VILTAAATADLDGPLSRATGTAGAAARLLDPVADKLFLLGVLSP